MDMPAINLVPAEHRIARRRRARVRGWFRANAAYATVVVAAIAAVHGVGLREDRGMRAQLQRMSMLAEQARVSVDAVEARLSELEETLSTDLAVGEQPDWSVLLGLLAASAQDEVVLKGVKLGPFAATDDVDTRRGPFQMEVTGYALSQLAASGFVLRLEKLELFSDLTMRDTRREPFMEDHAVAFRIEGRIDG